MSVLGINDKAVSELKDPFNEDCIEEVWFVCQKDRWHPGGIRFWAKVEFKNGKTKGEQEIEAGDFKTLVHKVEIFVKELRNV